MTIDTASELVSERSAGILCLTINRPRAANAINGAVAAGIVAGLADAAGDASIRAVILTGTGEKVFCAGRDLKNPLNLDMADLARMRREESQAYNEALLAFEKPLVVALNGATIGAGLMLALHADQVVAAEHALLSLPEINIGIATFLGHALVAEVGGNGLANDLMLTGRQMTAGEAMQKGLVHAVVPAGRLAEEALARANLLGAKPPATFHASKGWILQRRRHAVGIAYAAHDAQDAAKPDD